MTISILLLPVELQSRDAVHFKTKLKIMQPTSRIHFRHFVLLLSDGSVFYCTCASAALFVSLNAFPPSYLAPSHGSLVLGKPACPREVAAGTGSVWCLPARGCFAGAGSMGAKAGGSPATLASTPCGAQADHRWQHLVPAWRDLVLNSCGLQRFLYQVLVGVFLRASCRVTLKVKYSGLLRG